MCVLRVSVLPLSEVKPISSTHKYIKRGKTDILNTQIHRKR
jgi:hypothetical protein